MNSHTTALNYYNGRNHKAVPFTRFKHRSWNRWWFQKKNVPLPATACRFAGSCRETSQVARVLFVRVALPHVAQLENRQCKKIEPFVGGQASKAKEKGNERLEGNAKAAATRPWKSQIWIHWNSLQNTDGNFQHSWTLKSIFKTYGWFFCR